MGRINAYIGKGTIKTVLILDKTIFSTRHFLLFSLINEQDELHINSITFLSRLDLLHYHDVIRTLMLGFVNEFELAVDALAGFTLIQVDVDSRMSEGSSAAVAANNVLVNLNGRNFIDKVHSPPVIKDASRCVVFV